MHEYHHIWNPGLTLEILNSFSSNTMSQHLGIEFSKITDNTLSATMPVDYRTNQPFGLLHGGASAVLAETLGSVASFSLKDALGVYVGLEVNATHLRSATAGIVTGIVSPIKLGKRIHVWQIDIYQESKYICRSTLKTILKDPNREETSDG